MASPPVMTSISAPRMSSASRGPERARKRTPCAGSNAARIAGSRAISAPPRTAIVMNQTIMIGPKMTPIPDAPLCWIEKSPVSSAMVIGGT